MKDTPWIPTYIDTLNDWTKRHDAELKAKILDELLSAVVNHVPSTPPPVFENGNELTAYCRGYTERSKEIANLLTQMKEQI